MHQSAVSAALTSLAIMALAVIGSACAHAAETPAAWGDAALRAGYVVFGRSTMARIPNDAAPTPAEVISEAQVTLAQGEYESLQIGVHALGGALANLQVTFASDLEVTVYHRRADRIDPAATAPKGSTPAETWLQEYLEPGETVARLPAGASVNFWLTLRAEPGARPGTHQGTIHIAAAGKPVTEIPLKVQVRPFRLEPARIPFGMYYVEGLQPGALDEARLRADYADMAAHSHTSAIFDWAGDFSQLPPRRKFHRDAATDIILERRVALAREAGLVSQGVPSILVRHNINKQERIGPVYESLTPEGRPTLSDEQITAAVAWLRGQHEGQGWPEMLLYGWDEPAYASPKIRPTFVPLRTLPVRLTTAMSDAAAYAHGDFHDVWIVLDGEISPGMEAEARRRGAQVWTYSFRVLRGSQRSDGKWGPAHDPLTQRYYAGCYTWALKLGGNYVWAYYHAPEGKAGYSMNYVWWDPVSKRDLPTTGYENRREGIDDYRYLQMVEAAVKAHPGNRVAAEAAVWLERLRATILSNPDRDRAERAQEAAGEAGYSVATGRFSPSLVNAGDPLSPTSPLSPADLEAMRAKAAEYIEKLGAAETKPPAVTYVRDEAAAFRGSSIERCIEGLSSPHASARRSAAWAFFEMGSAAAPAVPALCKLLDDSEVLIPALRALESIGPPAYQAMPRIATLLTHDDDFVRLGADRALNTISGKLPPLVLEPVRPLRMPR